MKAKQHMFLAMSGLVVLSGCMIGNVTDWADETFYQGQMYKENITVVRQYLKSIRLYDQFETVGMFDVLWNSDEVRMVYSRLYAKVMGKDEEGELAFLRRQLSANVYSVCFYVLSLNNMPLTATPPTWVMYLEIDGKRYLPADIKLAELPGEYVLFFGKKLNNHKLIYEVKFDRKDTEGNDILAGKKVIKLFFTNPRYFGSVGWQLDKEGNVTDQVILDKTPKIPAPKVTKKQRSLERRRLKKQQEQECKNQEKHSPTKRFLGAHSSRQKSAPMKSSMVSDEIKKEQSEQQKLQFLELESAEIKAQERVLLETAETDILVEEYNTALTEDMQTQEDMILVVEDAREEDENQSSNVFNSNEQVREEFTL